MEPIKHDEQGRVTLPQPDEIPRKEKEYAAGSYIMMFASQYLPLPLVNLLAAFIYYMFCRKRNRFVAFHAYQSWISQIPTSLLTWGFAAWVIYLLFATSAEETYHLFFNRHFWIIGLCIFIWNLIYMIYSLIAYVKAGKGKLVYLPIFGKIAFQRYFGANAIQIAPQTKPPHVNRPPDGL